MDTNKNDKQTTMGRKHNITIHESQTSLLDSYLHDCQQQPSSPASSSTSQTTGDTTFEPSIDMMVNDFDDEQTLTEEEALAELEAQDPADEIETLQKESEIPLEKLLAHYRQHVEQDYQQRRHKRKKSTKKHKPSSRSSKQSKPTKSTVAIGAENEASSSKSHRAISTQIPIQNSTALPIIDEVIVIEESEDEVEILKTEQTDTDAGEDGSSLQEHEFETNADEEDEDDGEEAEFDDCSYDNNSEDRPPEHTKLTALALLYPDKYANVQEKMDDECSEEDDDDDDYVKKTIMVGSAYQATIPTGLSKYGDVLPYENEDKLIWEPSQVSEQEVEDYLIRVKELKSSPNLLTQEDDLPSSSASVTSESDQGLGSSTVKDDEQALHLLVQCGYNFKEALRRKRLNAVPLTCSMSLWSEEECRNFEEGIQKFGKDFRKIRHTQVRTRSIRELVQFYYLWKKTERRDQDFVDSDTIDHMDVYLDYDERDTGSNSGSKLTSSCLLASDAYLTNQDPPSKKHHHHNFSIMNETNRSSGSRHNNLHTNSKKSSPNKRSYRRRSSLLSGSKSKHNNHYNNDNSSIFTKKLNSETTSSSSSGKNCRNNNSNSNSSSVNSGGTYLLAINNTLGNHSNKK